LATAGAETNEGYFVIATTRYDTLITGGTVIDGTGAPGARADVGVAEGRIVAVGDLGAATAERAIDASGLVVAPGFIDVHTHDDNLLLTAPEMAPKASQGVTTVIAGNCGVSLAPLVLSERPPPPLDLLGEGYRFPRFAAYVETLEAAPAATNAAFLVGHATLRVGAMDDLDRPADDGEIAAMRAGLGEALDAGAVGLSTGLFYPPARAAPTSEIVALAALLKPAGGLYTTHMRNENSAVIEAIEETLEIGRRADVPVVISHHKVQGKANFGRTRETLALIEAARASQRVALDVYPYIASSTVLMEAPADQAMRVLVTWSEAVPEAAGRDLDDLAADWGLDRTETIARLRPAGAVYFAMDEDDVRRVLGYARAMIGSDGLPHDTRPHPRLWGAFARVLGHYARDVGLFSLAEAVHRMTGLPAAEFGLVDRGAVAPGNWADLTLFDPATIIDRATFADPIRPAAGIVQVLVNGEPIWRDGAATGARPGRVLRRQAA